MPKFAECNNCGAVHKVIDICKSEIVIGRDDVATKVTKEDLKFSIPSDLYHLLETYERPDVDFEHADFIIENKKWGDFIVLKKEEFEDHAQGKLVRFVNKSRFKVESFSEKKEV